MVTDRLKTYARPRLSGGNMILAFSGWMDGGEVSTGTVKWLANALGARKVAEIDPDGFYIYNFPGTMEFAALFRPNVDIQNGTVSSLEFPTNTFHCAEEHGLVMFSGKEPNLNWGEFAHCIFSFAAAAGVSTLYFVGSYGGLVPHSREPRLVCTVSDAGLRATMKQYGVGFASYQGPAGFATYLVSQAPTCHLQMANLVAEIPAYIEGTNPESIEAVVRKLAAILGLQVDLEGLRKATDVWERRLNRAIGEKPDLAKHIRKLEEDYDNEVFDTQMGDLKVWLEQQGIRVD